MGINDVMTTAEAAERWGKEHDTIKHICNGSGTRKNRFMPDEFRKSGRTWLVTRAGMERLFGKEKPTE
ncbi:helix-turn-helix domain-containing protein [Selenomonas sp. F0473]|uniref:helix-turn-helix domain-containing protein n=1 Tax=Selenomonas sp. F0473 TaxID=999423 RepID=UPI003459E1F2